MLSDSALMEAARYCDNDLALVLGERLEELWHVEQQLEEAQAEIEGLTERCDHWQAEANMLQASLDRIDAE
jgi:predicted nuclease with TOPRIM domain